MVHPLVTEYEARRKAAGIPAKRVFERAKVGPATVWRWLLDVDPSLPNLGTLDRLNKALDDLIHEQQITEKEA